MSDHIPDTGKMGCPKCGAEQTRHEAPAARSVQFECGSAGDATLGMQSTRCIEAERDQLRAQVEDLESQLEATVWQYSPAMAEAKIQQLNAKAQKLVDELNKQDERAAAWKLYAERLEIAGDTLATVTLRNGRSHEQWHAAKETKP